MKARDKRRHLQETSETEIKREKMKYRQKQDGIRKIRLLSGGTTENTPKYHRKVNKF
jgi:hypothetical protein